MTGMIIIIMAMMGRRVPWGWRRSGLGRRRWLQKARTVTRTRRIAICLFVVAAKIELRQYLQVTRNGLRQCLQATLIGLNQCLLTTKKIGSRRHLLATRIGRSESLLTTKISSRRHLLATRIGSSEMLLSRS